MSVCVKICWFVISLGLMGSILANDIAIKDTNFRNAIKKLYPSIIGSNGRLDTAVAARLIDELDISNQKIASIDEIIYFKKIPSLRAGGNLLVKIPSLSAVKDLKILDLSKNLLTTLPSFDENQKLIELYLYSNRLELLPKSLNLPLLQYLDVVDNRLTSLPYLGNLKKLKTLLCKGNQLKNLPKLDSLPLLVAIDASFNLLESIPDITNNPNLTTLHLNDNMISDMDSLGLHLGLKHVFLRNNLLVFKDLINVVKFNDYNSIFDLDPQQNVISSKVYSKNTGDTLRFQIGQPFVAGVFVDWYFNGRKLASDSSNTFYLGNLTAQNMGNYIGVVKHKAFPAIKFYTDTIVLNVAPCVDSMSISVSTISYDCAGGGAVFLKSANEYVYELKNVGNDFHIKNENGGFTGLVEKSYDLSIYGKNGCRFHFGSINIETGRCNYHLITPNQDGISDYHYFDQNGAVRIYDKSGDLVQEAKTPFKWEGMSKNGTLLPQGLYFADINGGEDLVKLSLVY